ncbi:hypothetical protein PK35_16635 [Tamlana nanhaiensis]|uniref:Uncharacterized protein n=1 Tax=Neotamlana nanhaiensis TaxID=1382798 RepID=A0A0D7VW77_9FLAO|nr:rhamnogalacturonan acetylesterase [Tamlana nanhaiensis]KJD31101.1 hypothetical protein PK35_16635 [Tamlana nanhaiensis]
MKKSFQATVFIALLSTFTLLAQNKKTTIYLVGDSTMCLYDDSRFPQEGWGMPFANFFNASAKIENHAKGGRSSRSFIEENRWQPIVDSLQAGDYVLIQFGHNDAQNSKDHPDRKTTPNEYKTYLKKYITESQSRKAKPIIITPVTRWRFNNHDKAQACHTPYSNAAKEVAIENNIPLIDLDQKSRELLNSMGKDASRYLFMYFNEGEFFKFPNGYPDDTHFTDFGARKMAEIVLNDILKQELDLANFLIKPYERK